MKKSARPWNLIERTANCPYRLSFCNDAIAKLAFRDRDESSACSMSDFRNETGSTLGSRYSSTRAWQVYQRELLWRPFWLKVLSTPPPFPEARLVRWMAHLHYRMRTPGLIEFSAELRETVPPSICDQLSSTLRNCQNRETE